VRAGGRGEERYGITNKVDEEEEGDWEREGEEEEENSPMIKHKITHTQIKLREVVKVEEEVKAWY